MKKTTVVLLVILGMLIGDYAGAKATARRRARRAAAERAKAAMFAAATEYPTPAYCTLSGSVTSVKLETNVMGNKVIHGQSKLACAAGLDQSIQCTWCMSAEIQFKQGTKWVEVKYLCIGSEVSCYLTNVIKDIYCSIPVPTVPGQYYAVVTLWNSGDCYVGQSMSSLGIYFTI